MIDIGLLNQLCGNAAQTNTNYTGMNAVTAPDAAHHIYSSATHTTEATLTNADIMSISVIPRIIALAQGGLPFPIKPLVIKGIEIAGALFMTAQQVRDLKTNFTEGEWANIYGKAMQGGQITGNPIFSGAVGFYENVVLHQDTRCAWGDNTQNLVMDNNGNLVGAPTSLGAAAAGTTDVGRAVFVGAQAASFASGAIAGPDGAPLRVKWVEELLDAQNQLRITGGMIWGLKKNIFNAQDFATIVVSSWNAP